MNVGDNIGAYNVYIVLDIYSSMGQVLNQFCEESGFYIYSRLWSFLDYFSIKVFLCLSFDGDFVIHLCICCFVFGILVSLVWLPVRDSWAWRVDLRPPFLYCICRGLDLHAFLLSWIVCWFGCGYGIQSLFFWKICQQRL